MEPLFKVAIPRGRVFHYDAGGLIVIEEKSRLSSPIAVLNYEEYSSIEDVNKIITERSDEIQCIIGANGNIPFGDSQIPALSDYADGTDTMAFLCSLSTTDTKENQTI